MGIEVSRRGDTEIIRELTFDIKVFEEGNLENILDMNSFSLGGMKVEIVAEKL
jgi:hypothetical protein